MEKLRCLYCNGLVPATSWVSAPNIYWCPACQRQFELDGAVIIVPVKKAKPRKRGSDRLPARVKGWVSQQPDKFFSWQLDEALGITTQREKTLRRVFTARLCARGKLVRLMPGCFRYARQAKRINWQD